MTEAETSKQRSAARSAVLDVLAGAPPEGLAVAAIMALANVVSRDAADHLLYRMVRDGEVERRGRGRYVRASTAMPDRMQPQTAPARTPVEPEVEKLLQAVGKREESRLGPKPGLAAVRTADPLDLGTFCARVGCAYVKHGLCPPFALREAAAAWAADGVALSHCLSAIEEHLRDHAASCRSGSGDRLFGWLDKIIRHSWNKSHPASRLPPARTN